MIDVSLKIKSYNWPIIEYNWGWYTLKTILTGSTTPSLPSPNARLNLLKWSRLYYKTITYEKKFCLLFSLTRSPRRCITQRTVMSPLRTSAWEAAFHAIFESGSGYILESIKNPYWTECHMRVLLNDHRTTINLHNVESCRDLGER